MIVMGFRRYFTSPNIRKLSFSIFGNKKLFYIFITININEKRNNVHAFIFITTT